MKPIFRVTLIAAVAATCFALVSASQTYLSMLNHGHSFARMFVWQLGCWGFWAVAAPVVVRHAERHGVLRICAFGIALSIVHILFAALITYWLQPYVPVSAYGYEQALRISLPFLLGVDPLVYGLIVVGGTAVTAYDRARALELRKSQLEVEVARAQLDALRLEIHPHFLFNTLNSIAALIRTRDNTAALTMLVGLSELMRSTLERPAGQQLLPLGEEVNLVKRYVDIQRVRFGDRLDVSYRIDSACEQVDVPAFLLQPIVENALRHGLADSGPCHVEIGAAAHDGSAVRLWVTDDGTGLPAGFDVRRHAGTGLSNASARIMRLYGSAASLTLRPNSPTGTVVELILPRGAASTAPA